MHCGRPWSKSDAIACTGGMDRSSRGVCCRRRTIHHRRGRHHNVAIRFNDPAYGPPPYCPPPYCPPLLGTSPNLAPSRTVETASQDLGAADPIVRVLRRRWERGGRCARATRAPAERAQHTHRRARVALPLPMHQAAQPRPLLCRGQRSSRERIPPLSPPP